MCHVSHVTCHMSHVTCHFFSFFSFGQSSEAYRVCYQRGLPRLVFIALQLLLSLHFHYVVTAQRPRGGSPIGY